jgi:hypothetical protein
VVGNKTVEDIAKGGFSRAIATSNEDILTLVY